VSESGFCQLFSHPGESESLFIMGFDRSAGSLSISLIGVF